MKDEIGERKPTAAPAPTDAVIAVVVSSLVLLGALLVPMLLD